MKILLVNKFHYMKGGSEKYYFTLAELLEKKGHEVIFFALKSKKNYECDQQKYFIENSDYNGKTSLIKKINMIKNMNYSKEAYKNMTKLLSEEKPDLVILNLIHRQITCSIIDAIKDYNNKIPVFWIMHDLITVCPRATMLNGKYEICDKCLNGNYFHCVKNKCIKNSKLKSFLAYREANYIIKEKLYDKVDLFISPSQCHTEILKKSKFTQKPIVHLKNFLSPNYNYSLEEDNEGYALFFGRLAKDKGVYTLIEAFRNIKQKLLIVGSGEEEEGLKKIIKEKNIDNIDMLGFKNGEELEKLISKAKVIVLTSEWYENCPYSIMESMAKGKPIIVSNIGGLSELVSDGENGFLVEPRNSDSIIKAINKVYELDDEEYKKMCILSLERAKELFNSDKYYEKIMNLYKSIKG